MPTTVFEPSPEARSGARIIGCFFMVVGGVLAGAALALGLFLMAVLAEGGSDAGNVMFGALCCGFPFGLVFVFVGFWTGFLAARNERVVLEDGRLTHGSDGLALARVVRVSARQGWQRRTRYWAVALEDDAGGALELEATQDGYVGTFDLRAVLAAVLPLLPASCAVEPRVRAYAAGARLE